MKYAHRWMAGTPCDLPVGKAVCVGRNYAAHAMELNNPLPKNPVLFLKPATSFVPLTPSFSIPDGRGECHHEVELALLIGAKLSNATLSQAAEAVAGVAVGLDLTLRDVQQQLKSEGLPWEIAKAFDGALPLAPFIRRAQLPAMDSLSFALTVNGSVRQEGSVTDMITPIPNMLAYISQHFTLMPGDVVMTGTPAGVAKLSRGDHLNLRLQTHEFHSEVS